MSKLLLLISILTIVFAGFTQQSEPEIIRSLSPDDTDYSDLRSLDIPYENLKVIGIGEATHGTREFTLFRHRMFQFLIEEKGFNTLFLEVDFADALGINDYVQGRIEYNEELMRDLRFWPYQTAEMLNLLVALREYNLSETGRKVSIVGCDAQDYKRSFSLLKEMLNDFQFPYSESGLTVDLSKIQSPEELLQTDEGRANILSTLEKLPACFHLLKNSSIAPDSIYFHTLVTVTRQAILKKTAIGMEKYIYRNLHLSNNILHYLKEHSGSRGLFWAHNGHLSMNVTGKGKNRLSSAGYYLNQELNDGYFCIAQDFDQGSFIATTYNDSLKISDAHIFMLSNREKRSLGYFYRKQLDQTLYLSVNNIPRRRQKKIHAIGSTFKEGQQAFYKGVTDFDAIILTRNSSYSDLLFWVNKPGK